MKLSDYVFSFLKKRGVKTVFYLPGGGCMHLLDSLGRSGIQAVSLLHEQAVAVACEAYANQSGHIGVALVSTGPGATNALTGILGAWLDSSPCLFLSGQVKRADLKSRYGVRSLGSQEADIVTMATPITKYSAMLTDPNSVRVHLERAWHEAFSGRMGSVLLDIPLDIQAADIEVSSLAAYVPPAEPESPDISELLPLLKAARRPLLLLGNGLRGCTEFSALAERLGFPLVPSWKALDLVPNAHPLYAGRVGGMGDRPGNLAMQNADLIVSLGCRLDFSMTGYDRTQWAPKAEKIVVEIDPAEIRKLEGVEKLHPLRGDVRQVVRKLLDCGECLQTQDLGEWKKHISEWQQRYPLISPEKLEGPDGGFSTYALVDCLSRILPDDAILAPCSAGTTAEIFFQAFRVRAGQTIRSNHGLGAMGFELPNAIGLCIASGGRKTVCIAGDGGIQLNIQELAVLAGRQLPITVFVVNNRGYASIRNMQDNHFQSRYIGCDTGSGLYLPDWAHLSVAYGLNFFRVEELKSLDITIRNALACSGPTLCEVVVEGPCLVSPRTASQVLPDGSMRSSPLENQYPFLTEEEVRKNIL